jgi:integrase
MEAAVANARHDGGLDGAGARFEQSMAETKSAGPVRLTDAIVRSLAPPHVASKITYDAGPGRVAGFGCRVTAAGAKAFILNYTLAGRERRLTIGAYPAWKVATARREAERLRQEIDRGIDPLGERIAEREAPTVSELCDRYFAEHAVRKRSTKGDESMIRRVIKPALGNRKVASIAYADIDKMHRKLSETAPYQANRLVALLSKMFSLSIRWKMRADNPCKGVERNHEERRYRYLTGDELRRLTEALTVHPSGAAANAVRLLLLTGARRGEVLAAEWEQFVGLEAGPATWVKPSSHTKQKREHRVPLSEPARLLLATMKAVAETEAKQKSRLPSRYLFPARTGAAAGSMTEIKRSWAAICKAADLRGVRLHDLRHTFASVLASAGLSLPVIGALLGHTQPGTTQRYAHLFDDPLRAATERAGAIVTGKDDRAGEVVPMERRQ